MTVLAACAMQPPYQAPATATPAQWTGVPGSASGPPPALAAGEAWWTQLRDPAIDALIAAALQDNPTLEQAAARVDEARAALGVQAGQRVPLVTVSASESRQQALNNIGIGSTLGIQQGSAQGGPNFAWEFDLWGRIKQSNLEAKKQLDARDADAQAARLSVASQVAGGVLNLRACLYSVKVREDDIASRQTELTLIRQRLAVGNVALVDEAEADSNLATAVTNRLSQNEQCARYSNVLVALAGSDIDAVQNLIAQPLPDASSMPPLPPMQLALPAAVLEYHPTIVSAERDVEAAWADIAVTKADRLPKVELDAALGGQWLSVFGTAYKLIVWSVGPALNGTLYDGGAGSSKVDAARARYREAQANLHAKVRSTVQNVQDALAQQVSADARLVSTQQARQAALVALRANEARWRVGAISRFDLETSRRQFEASEESAIVATRDRCLAWVALIQATGYGPSLLAAKLDPSHSGIPQS